MIANYPWLVSHLLVREQHTFYACDGVGEMNSWCHIMVWSQGRTVPTQIFFVNPCGLPARKNASLDSWGVWISVLDKMRRHEDHHNCSTFDAFLPSNQPPGCGWLVVHDGWTTHFLPVWNHANLPYISCCQRPRKVGHLQIPLNGTYSVKWIHKGCLIKKLRLATKLW